MSGSPLRGWGLCIVGVHMDLQTSGHGDATTVPTGVFNTEEMEVDDRVYHIINSIMHSNAKIKMNFNQNLHVHVV